MRKIGGQPTNSGSPRNGC